MEGFPVGRRVGVEQAQCKTRVEEREGRPEGHLEGHLEDHLGDRLEDRLEDLEPQENWQMVEI